MGRGYDRINTVFNSANSSTYTKGPYLAVDAATISVSWTTVNAVASRLTIQGSNDHGLDDTGAVTNYSVLTALTAPGLYTVDSGPRWLRFQRGSEESTATVMLQQWCT